jgi:hypothetical protein
MGIGDIGVGATPYVYNTSHFAGSLTLDAANGTYPGAYYFITPPAATGGSYNSPYYIGVQLNTVTYNISIPGDNASSFWTQNVLTMNGNWITFEDNVWNFTGSSLLPGTFYAYNGTPVYPVFYYKYGPSVPLRFPVTIDLYNNVSVVNNRDMVTFGYRVVDSAGTFQGIYDNVTFNNYWYPMAPAHKPVFQVNGKYTSPLGLDYDAELVWCGPGGGSNAVINNLTGTETLQYSNVTSGGWKTVPSAYDFGADTGETAIGVAETWAPGGTVTMSAGPSLLYGMWNTPATIQASSGQIEFQGKINTPQWGFVFMGDGLWYWNQSWVPTNSLGQFLTYLPPKNSVFPILGSYYLWGLADGYSRWQQNYAASATGLVINLATAADYTEPLYLNGNAQAENAASVLMGWVSGPVKFLGLTVLTGYNNGSSPDAQFFDHLNDWGFVSFNMFQATGVTDVLNVSGMTQGFSEAGPSFESYYMDGPSIGSPPTVLGIFPAVTNSLPQYGSIVAFYSDTHVQVWRQLAEGYFAGSYLDPSGYYALNPAGGAVVAWNDPGVYVNGTVSEYGSFGAYLAASPHANVTDVISVFGANAVSLAGSNYANVKNLETAASVSWHNGEGTIDELTFGIYDVGSSHGLFQNILAEEGATGYYGAGSSDSRVNNLEAGFFASNITHSGLPTLNTAGFSVGAFLSGTTGITVNDTYIIGGAIGVEAFGASGTTVTNALADGGFSQATLVYLDGASYTNASNISMYDSYLGGVWAFSGNTTFNSVTLYDNYDAMFGEANYMTTFNWVNETSSYNEGIADAFSSHETFNTVSNIAIPYSSTYAIQLEDTTDSAINGLSSTYGAYGVWIGGPSTGDTVTNTMVYDATGVTVEDGSGVTINTVSADSDSTGVELYSSDTTVVNGVTATNDSLGVYADPSTQLTISNVVAGSFSLGVEVYESTDVMISTVSASDFSIGAYVESSTVVTISGVTATGTAPAASPYVNSSYWDLPVSAVVLDGNTAVTVSGVTTTNYGAAVYDFDSDGLYISGVSSTGDYYGVVFDGTYASTVTGSTFTTDVSYAVDILSGEDNTVWGNVFTGNNGATATFSPSNVQAFSAEYNTFYVCTNPSCTTGMGNTWSDWHTYGANGYLAPYPISAVAFDLFPVGPQETFTVSFTETGLFAGTTWSVTLNGVTMSSMSPVLNFTETIGTYSFMVSPVSGYSLTPSSGTVTVSGANYSVPLTFTPIPPSKYAVTLTESGLSSGAVWSATVNSVTQSTSGTSLVFYLVNGSFTYSFNVVSGYTLGTNSSGSGTIAGTPMSFAATYTPTSTPSYVQTGTFNNWLAVALAVAVIALVIGLLAMFLRRRKEPSSSGAQAWTPPSGTSSGGAPGGEGAGGSGSWSEGPPAGGSPPS